MFTDAMSMLGDPGAVKEAEAMMNDPEFKSEISQYMETLKNNSAFRDAMAEAQRKYQVSQSTMDGRDTIIIVRSTSTAIFVFVFHGINTSRIWNIRRVMIVCLGCEEEPRPLAYACNGFPFSGADSRAPLEVSGAPRGATRFASSCAGFHLVDSARGLPFMAGGGGGCQGSCVLQNEWRYVLA